MEILNEILSQEVNEHLVPVVPVEHEEELHVQNMAEPQDAAQDDEDYEALPAEEPQFQDLEFIHVVPQANPEDNVMRRTGRTRPPRHQFFHMPPDVNLNVEEDDVLERFRIESQVLESMPLYFPLPLLEAEE